MLIRTWYLIGATIAFLLLSACTRRPDPLPGLPHVFVWAWERPENLSWIDVRSTGVAFLSRTVCPRGDGVGIRPRMQPLATAPGTILMAVVRVESGGQAAAADPARTAAAIVQGAAMPGVRALQVDFDAVASEREFYRAVLRDVRRDLPAHIPLSMTALASWCQSDEWLSGLPVAEAVPMLFRMGRERYVPHGDFREPLCRSSVGIATDELPAHLPGDRRVYVFHPRPWSAEYLEAVLRKVGQWRSEF